jgi:hypothetical protein
MPKGFISGPKKSNWTRRQLDFYRMWQSTNFDPKKRYICLVKAGYSPRTQGSHASETLRSKIQKEMKRQGLDPELLIKKHISLLDAKNETGFPDNSIQFRALDLAYRISDAFPETKLKVEKRETSVHFDLEVAKVAEEITGEKIINTRRLEDGSYDPDDIEAPL